MKQLVLQTGEIALVSNVDYARVRKYSWRRKFAPNGRMYVYYHDPETRKDLPLHRVIKNLADNDPRIVHHRNGNGLDNRRSNLKIVTRKEHCYIHYGKIYKQAKCLWNRRLAHAKT